MCELLGMSANTPTDICFSFSGLMRRGGGTAPHKDGWGVAFYQGRGVREFRDPFPGVDSEIARLVKRYPIKSDVVISHIRKANSGRICLENTHPFIRELWGCQWTFAHNGQLRKFKQLPLNGCLPVGTTDSEYAFCWMLNQIRERMPVVPRRPQALWRLIKSLCDEITGYGVYNILLCDSKHLYAYCSTKLHWITRKAPFGKARLKDDELTVDFYQETTAKDVVSVIATEPLTTNETWNKIDSGSMVIFRNGVIVRQLDG